MAAVGGTAFASLSALKSLKNTNLGANRAYQKRSANQLVGNNNIGRTTMKRLAITFSAAALIASLASAKAGDVNVVQNSLG